MGKVPGRRDDSWFHAIRRRQGGASGPRYAADRRREYPGSGMIEAVTFDVTHTLVHCPRLGEIYSEVLGRHGVEVAPGEALRLIGLVWREMACSADPSCDRFNAHPEGARGWWQRFLARFCEHLEAPPPSRFAAAELFHRFGTAAAWEVYPEVPEVLDALRARGLRLGVISMGQEPGPPDLGAARHAIDMLAMLSEKTRGNLSFEEQRLMENSLTELRFRFVQVSENTLKAKAAATEPDPTNTSQ